MSTIYKITGDFEQRGQWVSPGFEGYFVQDDTTTIKGYMSEKYECFGYSELRFITGRYDDNTGELEFIKFSNESDLDTLIYVFKDVKKDGLWAVLSMVFGYFKICGRGRVTVSETDEVSEEDVIAKFNYMNMELMDHGAIYRCFGQAKDIKKLLNEDLHCIINNWFKD